MITSRFFQIVDCDALPTLILMLGSEDAAIHYEAVRFIWDPLFVTLSTFWNWHQLNQFG